MTSASSPPLVSVVIPSYQHAAYVQRAVESVLEQTVTDIEVIVVDDGSTDGTPDVVAAIRDPRLRLVRLAENRREHARNRALGMATGRYVAFQNSDDEWLPDKLAIQLAALESQPEVGVAFTEVAIIDRIGSPMEGSWANGLFCDGGQQRSAEDWLRLFFDRNCLCITSAMVRHELLRRVGNFRLSLVQLSDLDLWIRLAAVSELLVIPQALTCMRVDGNSNLSAPSPQSAARAALEMADVLENYARPPLLMRLPSLFPQAYADGPSSDPVINLAAFACYAAAGSLSHRLFADRILSRLIDDKDSREKLIAAFGARIIQCFLERRANWAVFGNA
jgi:glycosyltransferase involved in cell wall biosynthesis